MLALATFLTGGFLAGYRTYICGGLLALQAVAAWALGDQSLSELITKLQPILEGLGLMSLRAGIAATAAPMAGTTPAAPPKS